MHAQVIFNYQFEIGPLLELKQQDGDCLSSV